MNNSKRKQKLHRDTRRKREKSSVVVATKAKNYLRPRAKTTPGLAGRVGPNAKALPSPGEAPTSAEVRPLLPRPVSGALVRHGRFYASVFISSSVIYSNTKALASRSSSYG